MVLLLIRTTQDTKQQTSSVKKILSNIPKEDYQALDALFRCLVFERYFAYTLFGSKPMTHYGAFCEQHYQKITHPGSKFIFLNYWKVWKKYSHLPEFQTANFVFIEEKDSELFRVHFLNKKNVIRNVKDNIHVFQEVLGDNITPEQVLDLILKSNNVDEALGAGDLLCGILFGFGIENARAFHQIYQLGLPLKNDAAPFHNEEFVPYLLPLPYFMVFQPSTQTEMLRKQYQQEREKILELYSKGNFLEITLTQLLKET